MATIEYSALSNINAFNDIELDTATTSTLPKKLTPLDKFYILKEKEKQERDRRIVELCKELDTYIDIDNTETIKKWIEKTGGCYRLKTYVKFVSELENSYQNTIKDLQEKKSKSLEIFWNPKKDGNQSIPSGRLWGDRSYQWLTEYARWYIYHDDYGEVRKRNNKIYEIREKYTSSRKAGKTGYGNLGCYGYKSEEAYAQFLKEVEDKGFARPIPEDEKDNYNFESGFHHAVNINKNNKLTAKQFTAPTSGHDRDKSYQEIGTDRPFAKSLIGKKGGDV